MRSPVAAIIGAGSIAPFHVDALRRAGFDVAHVAASLGSKRAARFGAEHRIARIWDDPLELIRASDWDLIVLAASTEANGQLLKTVIETRKLCLVEKPISVAAKDVAGYKDHSLIRVSYNRRFYASVQKARAFVREGPCLVRLELPEMLPEGTGLRAVSEHSVHGFDLLNYLFPGLRLASTDKFESIPGGRTAILRSARGDVCVVILNWNCPANFALVMDRAPRRLELRPFEQATLYEGMDVIQPTVEASVRQYVPRIFETVSSFPGPGMCKPGFLEQAQELRSILRGKPPLISAGLQDAYRASALAEALIAVGTE